MAKAPTATVLTGAALLSAIATGAVARITQEQATTLDASHIEVNTADVVDGGALVRLTDAGKAAAGVQAPASTGIEIDDGVPMPTGQRRAPRETVYPFDKLEVGQSFHVAKTAENPDPATRLSSSVSGARVRFSDVLVGEDGKPLTETYTAPIYQRTEDGKGWAKDEAGKRIKTGDETKTREKRGEPSRDFMVKAVDASDPKGEGARCWRTK